VKLGGGDSVQRLGVLYVEDRLGAVGPLLLAHYMLRSSGRRRGRRYERSAGFPFAYDIERNGRCACCGANGGAIDPGFLGLVEPRIPERLGVAPIGPRPGEEQIAPADRTASRHGQGASALVHLGAEQAWPNSPRLESEHPSFNCPPPAFGYTRIFLLLEVAGFPCLCGTEKRADRSLPGLYLRPSKFRDRSGPSRPIPSTLGYPSGLIKQFFCMITRSAKRAQGMALPPDKEKIEFLVRRRFRGFSLAHRPQPTGGHGLSISISEERISRKQPNHREATEEAYRSQLQAMTPDEVIALYEAECAEEEAERVKVHSEQRAKAEKEDRERFFNLPSAMADADHWSKAAYWSLDEATALSFGRAPDIVKWDTVKAYTQISPFAHKYEWLRDLILRAQGAQQLFDPVLPGFFIAWAKRNKINFPPELETAVVAHGAQVADWKSYYDDLSIKYDEALRLLDERTKRNIDDQATHAALKVRIAELEAKLNAAPLPERGLSGKERESVLKLVIGMAVKGYSFNPTVARSTAASEITSDLAELGLSISDDTVRKWLKEAAELLPPTDPT
jgi:hypothetical protein